MNIEYKKASTILTYLILKEYSDEDHYLSQQRIADLIEENYYLKVERKCIGVDIKMLSEMGFDVNKGDRKHGFALLSRNITKQEIDFILIALKSQNHLTQKALKDLIDNLLSEQSRYIRKEILDAISTKHVIFSSNKQFIYNLSIIKEAIQNSGAVLFKTISNEEFVLSPHSIVENKGDVLVVFNSSVEEEKYVFKIDDLVDVSIVENESSTPKNGTNKSNSFLKTNIKLYNPRN